jgi:hypothetical protein
MSQSNESSVLAEYLGKLYEDISEAEQKYIQKYVSNLDEMELQVFQIAIKNLESSFNLVKCSDYVKWRATQD